MKEIIKLIKSHTSIRKFNESEIKDEQIKLILESAMRGATAKGKMSYSIIKIRSKNTLLKLGRSCNNQPFIAKANLYFHFYLAILI